MRLQRITTRKLFGLFDHTVPLHTNERVTILHGPNGVGKTVLLKMIRAVFCQDFSIFFSVPFDELRLDFEDGASLTIRPGARKDARRLLDVAWVRGDECLRGEIVQEDRSSQEVSKAHIKFITTKNAIINSIYTAKGSSAPIGLGVYPMRNKAETTPPDRFQEIHPDPHPPTPPPTFTLPSWWTERLGDTPCTFQGIYRLSTLDPETHEGRHQRRALAFAIEQDAELLAETFVRLTEEYGKHSQELDATAMKRFVQSDMSATPVDVGDFLARQTQLKNTQDELKRFGLIEAEPLTPVDATDATPEHLRPLAFMLHDVEQKLRRFDAILPRLRLFRDMLGKRLQRKQLAFSPRVGFFLQSDTGDRIPLTALSSGEQHQIVMLYHLLFEVAPDSIVLLDEPELSLHLSWQREFMSDLIQIAKLNRFDAIVATHSPQIVGSYRHLMVELKTSPQAEAAA